MDKDNVIRAERLRDFCSEYLNGLRPIDDVLIEAENLLRVCMPGTVCPNCRSIMDFLETVKQEGEMDKVIYACHNEDCDVSLAYVYIRE